MEDFFHQKYHSTSGAKSRCSRQGFDKTPAFLVLDLVQLLCSRKWTTIPQQVEDLASRRCWRITSQHIGFIYCIDFFLVSFVFLCSLVTVSLKKKWCFGKTSVLPLAPACQRSWWWPELELVLKVVDRHLTISLFHRLPPQMTNQNKNIQTWYKYVPIFPWYMSYLFKFGPLKKKDHHMRCPACSWCCVLCPGKSGFRSSIWPFPTKVFPAVLSGKKHWPF